MSGNDENKRLKLFKAVESGAKAADLWSFLSPILSKRKIELVDKLETGSFNYQKNDYQKIDNSELLTIQLELRLLKKISDEAAALIRTGEESAEALRAMNEPEEPARPKRPLRY